MSYIDRGFVVPIRERVAWSIPRSAHTRVDRMLRIRPYGSRDIAPAQPSSCRGLDAKRRAFWLEAHLSCERDIRRLAPELSLYWLRSAVLLRSDLRLIGLLILSIPLQNLLAVAPILGFLIGRRARAAILAEAIIATLVARESRDRLLDSACRAELNGLILHALL